MRSLISTLVVIADPWRPSRGSSRRRRARRVHDWATANVRGAADHVIDVEGHGWSLDRLAASRMFLIADAVVAGFVRCG